MFGLFASQDEGLLDREAALAMFTMLRNLSFLTIETKDPAATEGKNATMELSPTASAPNTEEGVQQEVLLTRLRDKMFEYAEYLGGAKQACNFAEFKAWRDRSGNERMRAMTKELTQHSTFVPFLQPQGSFRDLRRGSSTNFWGSWRTRTLKSHQLRRFQWPAASHS